MKIKAGVNFHNRFDIVKNGEWVGYAENIILDQMYSRICNFSTYFVNIHFGTGTGIPTPDRTILFSHLGTKTAVVEETLRAYPTSKVTKKIVLNPEEYVEQTITEVGIAFDSTNTSLVTHAMIKDAEGNPLSITKSDIDVIEIYATVFITFTDGDTVFANRADRNTLVKYFTTHSSVTNIVGLGNYMNPDAPRKSMIQASKSSSRTADTANRKVTFNTVRFGIAEGNGPKNLAVLSDALSYDMGTHVGGTITDEAVGVGDNETTDFQLANAYPDNITVKVDGAVTTAYTLKNTLSISEIQAVVGKNSSGPLNFSVDRIRRGPNDNQVTICSSSDTQVTLELDAQSGEYIYIDKSDPFYGYKGDDIVLFCDDDSIRIVNGSVNKYNPVTGSHETIQTISGITDYSRLSHDGKLLVVSKGASGFSIYKWDDVTQQFDNIQNIALNSARGCDISQDNKKIVLSKYVSSPLSSTIYIYEYDDMSGLYEEVQVIFYDGKSINPIELSPSGDLLVVGASGYHIVFKHNGSEFGDGVENNLGYSCSGITFTCERVYVAWTTYYANTQDDRGRVFEITDSNDIISFNTPPAQDAVITADYTIPYIPKDEDHVLDVTFEIQFGEGV